MRQDMRRPRASASTSASASITGFGRRRGVALPGADFGALLLGLLGTMLLSSATGDWGRVSQHLQVCRVGILSARISNPWRVRFPRLLRHVGLRHFFRSASLTSTASPYPKSLLLHLLKHPSPFAAIHPAPPGRCAATGDSWPLKPPQLLPIRGLLHARTSIYPQTYPHSY